MDWFQYIDFDKIVEWRHWLHQHPELAYHEVETSKFITKALECMEGIEVLHPTATSVLGILKGDLSGKVVGLRADIDALPITEEAEIDFKSLNPGVMHACGHDTHGAMLLGAALALSQIKDQILGTIKFIFQHAEERTPGGAQQIIDTGLLEDVDYFFGEHVMPMLPVGTVGSRKGSAMAAQDSFLLKIQGKGAHGSMPEFSIDPILVGSDIVMNLNTIVSRSISPLENVVISMGRFTSGNIFNIIPDSAELEGTIRTNTREARPFVEKRIREIIDGICKAHGATYEIEYTNGYSAVINDDKCVDMAIKAVHETLGEGAYITVPLAMGSEDFSAYQEKAPGVFLIIGGGVAEDGYGFVNHHPKFKINEEALRVGVKMYVGFALEALRN